MDTHAADSRPSTLLPWLLAILAPVAAAICLVAVRSVFLTFLVYQVVFALLLPALDTLIRRRGRLRDHLHVLGLVGAETYRPRWLLLGVALGALGMLVVAAFLELTSGLSDPTERIRHSMHWWGITPAAWRWVSLFMLTLHVPAEELLWRGYLQTHLVGTREHPRLPTVGASLRRLALLSGLFAGYHAFTLGNVVPLPAMAAVMFAGVWLGGLVWSWLRWRTGSLWPALLSHYGAVAAYVWFVPDL